jgi:hypothetical protein
MVDEVKPHKNKDQDQDKINKAKRYNYTQGMDQILRRMTPKVAPKKGLLDGMIIQDWTSIVGEELADQCIPQKIVFPRGKRQEGVLHIGVYDGASGMMLQHKSPQILARVNKHYGYPAVSKITLMAIAPAEIKSRPSRVLAKPLTTEQQAKLQSMLEGLDDGPLKDALRGYGENLV